MLAGRRGEALCRAPTQKPQISLNPQLILNQQQNSGSGNSLLLSPFIVFAHPHGPVGEAKR